LVVRAVEMTARPNFVRFAAGHPSLRNSGNSLEFLRRCHTDRMLRPGASAVATQQSLSLDFTNAN
jgi:hypothetical protein